MDGVLRLVAPWPLLFSILRVSPFPQQRLVLFCHATAA